MKIQVLELPEVHNDQGVPETPFVLIFSEVERPAEFDPYQDIKHLTGARAVLVFEEPVEVVNG